METITKHTTAQMRYVVQCYISDKTGASVRIKDYAPEQLDFAYGKACEFYGNNLPVPDSGRYENYVAI